MFLAGPPNLGRGKTFHRGARRRHGSGSEGGGGESTFVVDPLMADLNPYTIAMPMVSEAALTDNNSDPGEAGAPSSSAEQVNDTYIRCDRVQSSYI